MTRTLFIPLLPVSKNPWTRMHWSRRASVKKAWEAEVWAQVNTAPRMPHLLPAVSCSILVLWGKKGPLPDHHNLEQAHECVADGLVKARVIADDSGGQYVRESLTVRRPAGEASGTYVTLGWG